VKEDATCRYMKKITLEKVYNALAHNVYEVKVPKDVAAKAKLAIDRMLAIS
jgi:quinolinate synthase